jgi:hypothetical protein
MRTLDPLGVGSLPSVARGQTHDIQDWRGSQRQFHVTVIQKADVALAFFCSGLQLNDLVPLDRQWICAANKLVNQVSHDLKEWRSPEAQSLGVVSASTELVKPLSNCPGLCEAQRLYFIERIDTPDLPRDPLPTLEGDPVILLRYVRVISN